MKKNDSKNYFFSLYKSFRDSVVSTPEVSLGNLIELPVLVKKMGWRVLAACFPSLTKFNARLRQLSNFSQHLLRMRKHHGDVFVVKYLKASQLAISKVVAGNPFKTLRELEPDLPLPRLSTCGLPTVIPSRDRNSIRKGHASTIRWWMTLFGLYRIIRIPGVLKISTITAPFSGDQAFLDKASMDLGLLCRRFSKVYRWKPVIPKTGLLFLESSSPNFQVSWVGAVHDIQLLYRLGLYDPLLVIVDAFWGPDSKIRSMIENILELGRFRNEELEGNHSAIPLKEAAELVSNADEKWEALTGREAPRGRLGQLSFKSEAAGKIRVFAMVDIWTQSVLKPVHDSLSLILKSLPNDGTFNQGAAVKRCFLKTKSAGFSYGFDLSAATDRLPISLQVQVMASLFGEAVASSWRKLLVEREYFYNYEQTEGRLKYSVGQPMGALSSFNMLALTHHLVVQSCALDAKVSKPGVWYDNYELLGDDIVIFDHLVAELYLSFMRGIGMEVNVKKSVVAKNATFEFAKVTGHNNVDVSALSWRMFISQNSFFGRANIAFSLMKRGIGSPGTNWLKNVLRHRRYTQGDFPVSLVAVFSMFAGSRLIPLVEFLRGMISMKEPLAKPFIQISEQLRIEYIRNLMAQSLGGHSLGIDQGRSLSTSWRLMWPFLKAHKYDAIKRCWMKYFNDGDVTKAYLCDLTDRICDMLAIGFTTSPPDTPKGVSGLGDAFDNLWWDIHDHVEMEMRSIRRKLDHIGLEAIDEVDFEELEKASQLPGSVDSLLTIPTRADEKLNSGAQPEQTFTQSVDAISWLSNARKSQLKKTPMTWYAKGWDIWYY